jgi:transmembrane sensor
MSIYEAGFEKAALIVKFLRNELTGPEKEELDSWLLESEENQELFRDLTSEDSVKADMLVMEMFPVQSAWEKLKAAKSNSVPLKPVGKIHPWYYATAAAILLVLFLSVYYLREEPSAIKLNVLSDLEKSEQIGPGTNKAILTTADGKMIPINDSTAGFIALQNNVDLMVKDGEIIYKPSDSQNELQFNTITTPKGGQFKIVLADGTKAWINAASSLRYPVAFLGKDRHVELIGEGYFEVAPDASKPFKVTTPLGEIRAIGTAFNVNAYPDEFYSKATLIEGKVRVIMNSEQLILIPGQQALFNNEAIYLESNVDTEEVVAWKNGQFVFKSASIEQIMKQLERWYDISVVFRSKDKAEKYSGIVSRSSNLSVVLKILSEGGVRFTIDDKKLTIQ